MHFPDPRIFLMKLVQFGIRLNNIKLKLHMNRRRRRRKAHGHARIHYWPKHRLDNWHEESWQRQRANWSELVPEIAFVLLKCRAGYERAHIREIADEAFATYPGSFETHFNGRKIPDYALILLTLTEAKKRGWGYAA